MLRVRRALSAYADGINSLSEALRIHPATQAPPHEPGAIGHLLVVVERPHPRVQQHESCDATGQRKGESDRSTVIVDDEGEPIEAERVDKFAQPTRMRVRCVSCLTRAIRKSKTKMVRRDASRRTAGGANDVAVLEGPGRCPVDKERRWTGSFVGVMDTSVTKLRPVGFERILGAIHPIGIRHSEVFDWLLVYSTGSASSASQRPS
jgi:hypothetical protein